MWAYVLLIGLGILPIALALFGLGSDGWNHLSDD